MVDWAVSTETQEAAGLSDAAVELFAGWSVTVVNGRLEMSAPHEEEGETACTQS